MTSVNLDLKSSLRLCVRVQSKKCEPPSYFDKTRYFMEAVKYYGKMEKSKRNSEETQNCRKQLQALGLGNKRKWLGF